LGYTKTGFPQASDCFVKLNQSGPVGIIKDRERSGYFEASARGFLSTCQLVDQHNGPSQFARERDSLALSEVQSRERDGGSWAHDFEPAGTTFRPLADRTGSSRTCQFIEYSGWNKNTRVQPGQDSDVVDENQVVDPRSIRYDYRL
jgi:hypothetical protein